MDKPTRIQAFRLLADKLEENKATVDDIFGLCALLPSLLPLIRAMTRQDDEESV